jgi:hypothetical protein
MSFDPSKLPTAVYQAYRQGPMAWPLVVDKAIGAGIRDVNALTDIVFFLHHSERAGRRGRCLSRRLFMPASGMSTG